MPVPDFSGLPPFADFNDVTTKINDLVQRLRQLLLTLDTLNVRELHAKKLVAESITGDKIQADTITADKMNVNELSAITANLGHIISGLIESVEIYGSYIATRNGSFPRAEMSSENNLFGAFYGPDNFITIFTPSSQFTPVLRFKANDVDSYIFYDSGDNTFSFTSNLADVNISTSRDIQLYASAVRLAGWSNLRSNGTGRTLQDDLDSKASRYTYTDTAGPYNCGIPIGTQLATSDGGYVTWMGVPEHSHYQK